MATLASINLKIGSSWTTLSSLTYPVGAYYLSNSSTSPASLFGGTWTRVTDNRFLCGASSVKTGGANSQQFTAKDIPNHKHGFLAYWTTSYIQASDHHRCVAYDATSYDDDPSMGTAGNWSTDDNNPIQDVVTVNNMPLYRSCYMWYRTA